MRLLLGLLLGLVLAAVLPFIQALLEAFHISPRDDAYLHAYFVVTLVLLSIILVRQPRRRRVEADYEGYQEPSIPYRR